MTRVFPARSPRYHLDRASAFASAVGLGYLSLGIRFLSAVPDAQRARSVCDRGLHSGYSFCVFSNWYVYGYGYRGERIRRRRDRTGHDTTGHDRTRQDRTGHDRTRQDSDRSHPNRAVASVLGLHNSPTRRLWRSDSRVSRSDSSTTSMPSTFASYSRISVKRSNARAGRDSRADPNSPSCRSRPLGRLPTLQRRYVQLVFEVPVVGDVTRFVPDFAGVGVGDVVKLRFTGSQTLSENVPELAGRPSVPVERIQ